MKRGRRPKYRTRLPDEVRPLSKVNPIRLGTVQSEQPPQPIATVTQAADHWRESLPLLWRHLTEGRGPDGSNRLTSTLLVFLEGGRIKLALHDREESRIAFLTVAGLPEGFIELESGLAAGRLHWRRKRPFP